MELTICNEGRAVPATFNDLYLAPTTLPNTAPLDYVQAAARGGYQGVGLRLNRSPGLPYHPVLGDAPQIRSLKTALAGNGLKVLDIYSFYLRPDTDVNAFIPALQLAAEFGAKFAVVMGDDEDASRLRDNFGRICDEAARCNLVCAAEFAVIRPLATLAQTVQLIAETGRTNAVACLDSLNYYRAGSTPDEIRGFDARMFPYAQISDGVRSPGDDVAVMGKMGPNLRCMMGEGEVPMAALLDALPQGLPLSVELPMPANLQHSADEWAHLTFRNVHEFLTGYYRGRNSGNSRSSHAT